MKKKIIIISIISTFAAIILCISIYFIIQSRKKVVTFSGNIDDESTIKEINSETLDVESYDPKDVIAYSLWRINNTKEFRVDTTGKSKAVGYSVKIKNERIVKNNEAMITCVNGGILKKCTQRYFNNDNVYIRKTEDVNKSLEPTFNSKYLPKYTKDKYIEMYGWMPFQAYGYILNDKTYKKDPSMTKNDDGTYTIDIDLDMDSSAVYYYKREIAINASSTKIPNFKSVNLQMTIDSNYYIKVVEIEEKYEVSPKKPPLNNILTTTSLTDTFTYDNIEFNEEYYNYFKENMR